MRSSLLEWALLDAATATARRDSVVRSTERLRDAKIAVRLALSAHAGRVSVEQGRVLGILSISVVVHVLRSVRCSFKVPGITPGGSKHRLVALVATFVPEGLLVQPNVVLVARE